MSKAAVEKATRPRARRARNEGPSLKEREEALLPVLGSYWAPRFARHFHELDEMRRDIGRYLESRKRKPAQGSRGRGKGQGRG